MSKTTTKGSVSSGMMLSDQFGKAEKFIAENRKSLLIIASSVVILVLLYIGYTKFYLAPREQEAINDMFKAQEFFRNDSLDKALNGDGNYKGFLSIIEEYDGTKSANLANFYTGVIYLKQGKFQEAIDHLAHYSAKDEITRVEAIGLIGDAYNELKQYDKAIKQYREAANTNPNSFTSPLYLMKLALVYETTNNAAKALETYKKIKAEYWQFAQTQNIDAYISKLEVKALSGGE
ncbi:MAG: tetratricopeptide repeat protein [Solitalea sp.]